MVLEGCIEIDNKGMADASENEALSVDVFHLPESDYICFTKDLHGKRHLLFALSQTDEQNASKCPCAYGESSKLWQVRTKRHDDIPRVSTT